MSYHGDYALGANVDFGFTTTSASTGQPTTLSGTPSVACYVGNSTTEITAGITLSVDFDSRTGYNHVRVVASSGNGYAAGTDIDVVITAGTVGGTSAVGYVVGSFSIQNRNVQSINGVSASSVTTISANVGTTQPINFTGTGGSALAKTDVVDFGGTAGTFASGRPEVNTTHLRGTQSVGAAGYVAPDFTTVTLPTGKVPSLGLIDNGTAQSATSSTLVLRSAAAFADNELVGATLIITGGTTGVGQSRVITGYVGSTDTATVDTWTTTPTGTIAYAIYGTAPASTASPTPVNVVSMEGQSLSAKVGENFNVFFQNDGADTTKVVDDVGGGGASSDAMLLQSTTIATLSTQTSFTLNAGSSDNDAYNGAILIFTDQSTSAQKSFVLVSDYVGSTKTITLAAAPKFTVATGDAVKIYAAPKQLPESALTGTSGGLLTSGTGTAQLATSSGNVTAATVSDKTGYSLSSSQTFNTSGSVGSVSGAVGSVTGNVGGNVTGSVGSVTGNVGGNVTGSVGSLATQAKADVNAQVDAALGDVGLTTDGVTKIAGVTLQQGGTGGQEIGA